MGLKKSGTKPIKVQSFTYNGNFFLKVYPYIDYPREFLSTPSQLPDILKVGSRGQKISDAADAPE